MIYRVKKESNYVVMNRTSLNDERLSWKAKGLHAYMLSMPDNWTFYNEELSKHSKDGIDSTKSAIKELKDSGYLKRFSVKDEKGKIIGWETMVFEMPEVENPPCGKPTYRETHQLDNPPLLSIDDTKYLNKLSNKEDIYTVFDHWNLQKITVHKELNQKRKSAINARLENGYTATSLIEAINNYSTVLRSDDCYWTHKWTLEDFMNPKNLDRFLNENSPLQNFRREKNYGKSIQTGGGQHYREELNELSL